MNLMENPAPWGRGGASEVVLAWQRNTSENGRLSGECQHRSIKRKREAIIRALETNPERSNRWIAESVGVDHKTVAAVRQDCEKIPQLTKTVGKDGRARSTKHKAFNIEVAKAAARILELRREIYAGNWSGSLISEHNRLIEVCRPHYPDAPSNVWRNTGSLGRWVTA
jgi:hypothetical protein